MFFLEENFHKKRNILCPCKKYWKHAPLILMHWTFWKSALCSFAMLFAHLGLPWFEKNVLVLKIKQVHVWSRRQPHARQCQKMKNHRRSTVWSIFSIWQGGLSDYKDKCYLKVLSLFVSVLIAKSNSSYHVCQKCSSFAGKVLKTYTVHAPL